LAGVPQKIHVVTPARAENIFLIFVTLSACPQVQQRLTADEFQIPPHCHDLPIMRQLKKT
jgi:hypothetical protein